MFFIAAFFLPTADAVIGEQIEYQRARVTA